VAPLSERETRVLAFERHWWRQPGAKEQAISDQLELSATRYYQMLNELIDRPEAMAADRPDRYIATMAKHARRGRVFIDFLRNDRGSTAVAAYSPRSSPQASVSTPLEWDELSEGLRSDHFTIGNVRHRLAFLKRDPWRDFLTLRQRIRG